MKTLVILVLSVIVFAYSSEPEGSSEDNDSDEEYLKQMAGWGPFFHEGIDPCSSNDSFLSHCVTCTCVGEKSALCNRGPSCFVPESAMYLKTPCELGQKFCIGPIHCVCDSTNGNLVTCDGNNYSKCEPQ